MVNSSDEDDASSSSEQQISVPSNTLKRNTTIENKADLEHLLCGLRFWGVSEVPHDVMEYCIAAGCKSSRDVLDNFKQQFHIVDVLYQILPWSDAAHDTEIAVQSGNLLLVQLLCEKGYKLVDGCYCAALHGHLDILTYLHQQGGKLTGRELAAALNGGCLPCVQYCREHGVKWPGVLTLRAGMHSKTVVGRLTGAQACSPAVINI